MARDKNSIPMFNVKHDHFKISFFPSTTIEWNNVDSESGDFQETYIGFHKTYRKLYLSLSLPWRFKTNYKDKAMFKPPSIS